MPQIIFILFFLFESAKLRRTTFCVIAISEMALFVGKCSNDQSRPFIGWVECSFSRTEPIYSNTYKQGIRREAYVKNKNNNNNNNTGNPAGFQWVQLTSGQLLEATRNRECSIPEQVEETEHNLR